MKHLINTQNGIAGFKLKSKLFHKPLYLIFHDLSYGDNLEGF